MLLADLGAAHRQPLQAALVDQRPGVIALRPLEGAARAGELQRLAGPALFQQLLHPAPDCRRVAGRQAELRPQHHRIRVIRQKAAAVAEGHLRPGEGPDALLRQQQGCLPHHLGHLPAVGAGIHAHRAAHRARDAVGEFQARQPLPAGEIRHPGQGGPRLRQNGPRCPAGLHSAQAGGGVDHQPVQPLVRGQQVGSVAHHQGTGAAAGGHVQQQHQLLSPLRKSHAPGRPPDAEGGVPVHGLLLLDPQVRQIIRRLLVKCDPPVHFWTSSYFRLPGPAGPHR